LSSLLQEAGNLSILFDVGGVVGGTIAGYLSGAPRCPVLSLLLPIALPHAVGLS
jgi:hypothetical protein